MRGGRWWLSEATPEGAESGDLERTWATTILASTAAASGMKVTLFFTFWGLFPLVRPGVRITGTNWMQKMLSAINRPGIDHLKLSRLNFAGMGPWMMKRLARQHGVAQPGELLAMAQAMGVRLIPCQMSMDMMGITPDQLIDGLEAPAGDQFGMKNYLVVEGAARVTEGGAPQLLHDLAQRYVGPGTKFPPMDDPPDGYIIRVTPTRIRGMGPWGTMLGS